MRIVLSGVARVAQRRVGCGKQLLAKMLCGSSDKAVERNRLNKLSTFGLLSHLTQTDVLQLTDALLLCGLLEQSEIEPFRPILQLTDRGTEVMSGRAGESLNLPLPDELWRKLDPTAARPPAQGTADDGSAAQAADVQPPPDASLVARLRQWRDATRKALNVPAYVVLTNAVMDELARVRPRSVDELSAVKGIGPKKAGQYGDELLAIVADRTSNEPREVQLSSAAEPQDHPPATSTSTTPAPAPPAQPSHYWTWRLLSTGFSPDECAEIRTLESEVVLDHALRAADQGWAVDARWFLSSEQITEIRAVVGDAVPGRIRPLLDKLPRGTRYEHVQLVVKSRESIPPGSADVE